MNWEEFKKVTEVKHRADLTSGDVLILSVNEGGIPCEEVVFDRAVCDGYAGKTEFWGYWEETGKRVAWCDGSYFKIIGKTIFV